jgi:hypothetical protein
LIVGIVAFASFLVGITPGIVLGFRPGIPREALPARKTKSRHPPYPRGRSFVSDDRSAVRRAGRSLVKPDSGCQRQRLSFIGRGIAPANFEKYSNNLRDLPGGPFRTSEAHRLPKSVAYVSVGFA